MGGEGEGGGGEGGGGGRLGRREGEWRVRGRRGGGKEAGEQERVKEIWGTTNFTHYCLMAILIGQYKG